MKEDEMKESTDQQAIMTTYASSGKINPKM
jgi:hypothetical protein